MLKCISKDFPDNISTLTCKTSFLQRPRILSSLLSCRNSLRVICAPSLYGKTMAAYEYAMHAFSSDAVCWIDASTPDFLLALDTPRSDEFDLRFLEPDSRHHVARLFVFDGVPHLDDDRLEKLRCLVAESMDVGHEVLLTTSDVRWLEIRVPKVTCVDARMLLLDPQERQERGVLAVNGEGDQVLMGRIVGCCGCQADDRDRFGKMLMDTEVHREEDAIALLMMVLGKGALHELRAFTQSASSTLFERIERFHPHAGIVALSPMFSAVQIAQRDRFCALRHHLSSIVAALPLFDDETDFIKTLIECLLARDQIPLALQIACGLHDDEERTRFLDERSRDLLFTGKPLLFMSLARTLPREAFVRNGRWMKVAFALGVLGEHELSLRVIRSFDEASEGYEHQRELGSEQQCSSLRSLEDRTRIILLKAMFGIAERDELSMLGSYCETLFALIEADGADEHALRPSLQRDVLEMVVCTLDDPANGMSVLERISSSGHALTASIVAACLFTGILLGLWRERIDADAWQDHHRAALRTPTDNELALMERLERLIVHLLARQASMLPPNWPALFLFQALRLLLGERAYLSVEDQTLAHIESARADLATQRTSWSKDKALALFFDGDPDEATTKRVVADRKQLRINTLGRFEMEAYDPKIVIKNKVRKQLRLLISLIAINEGREVSRPWVQQVMWPDAPERNAKQNLYTMWSLLNKSVIDGEGACPFFESYPQSLALNTQLVETDTQLLSDLCKRLRDRSLDVVGYEQAIERIEDLYRGPLLPGDDTAEVVANRRKYQQRMLEALLSSGEYLRKCGETTLALRYFRFAFDNEPTREDICYQLMLSLWKLGRHGEALNEYFVCRRALIDEYGIEGTPKLRELYEAILQDAS